MKKYQLTPDPINFPDILRRFRHYKKVTQEQAANITGVTRATWGAMEEGRAKPKLETLMEIAKAWNITLDDLVNGNWNRSNEKIMLEKFTIAYKRADFEKKKIVDFILHL